MSESAVLPQPELPLEFHGAAGEYFRIWIVSLCLTLLSLGVFSAWAKVRKKRYFYSHTLLDGTPFHYLGQPVPILKGRLAATALFAIYYFSSHFFTFTLPYVLAAGFVLAPWVVMRSAAFNARYSAFRNMAFQFSGSYWQAFKAINAWGLVPMIGLGSAFSWWDNPVYAGIAFGLFGLFFPFWLRRLKHFLISNTSFGGESGTFNATGRQYLNIYFKAGFILMGAGVVMGVSIASLTALTHNPGLTIVLALIPLYLGYVLSYAYSQAHAGNLTWNRTQLGGLAFRSTLTGRGLAKLYTVNALAIVASLGLLIPWAVIRTLKYRIDHLQLALGGNLAHFVGTPATSVQAAGAEVGEMFDLDLSL